MHRHAADHIVEHFVPVHDAQGIGTGIAVDRYAEHRFVIGKVIGVFGANQLWIDQRRDAILDDAAPGNLLEADVVGDAAAQKQAEVRVDTGVEVGLEGVEPFEGNVARSRYASAI